MRYLIAVFLAVILGFFLIMLAPNMFGLILAVFTAVGLGYKANNGGQL